MAELGISDSEARAWLRQRGLIRIWRGRRRVLWGEVLDAFLEEAGGTSAVTDDGLSDEFWEGILP